MPNDDVSIRQAGKKGSETRAQELVREGYQKFGKKYDEIMTKEPAPEFYREIGRRSGEARANDQETKSGEQNRVDAETRLSDDEL